jgi:multisubunit Na+/H+ antiporter MnhC subunit
VEKQYIFWDTGKGCLAALVIYTMAAIVLVGIFLIIPESNWLRILIGLAVFAVVTHDVYAVDKKNQKNRKIIYVNVSYP